MQPCQVCGTTAIDASGYCERCQFHSGAESYSVSPPAGASYYSGAPGVAGRASVAAYPAVTSGTPSDTGYPPPVEARPARSPLTVPLFLLTVIVIALVSATVAVVLVRETGSTAAPRANGAQAASTTAPASAPAASASQSAAPSGSSTVDKCVVGEWTVTTWQLPYSDRGTDGVATTSNGGTFRFRADGTGEWDFGSGVKLVDTGSIRKIAIRLTGRFTFSFRTTGQSFEFREVQADVRQEVTESEKVTFAGAWNPELGVLGYACAGDLLRWTPDESNEVRLQRRG